MVEDFLGLNRDFFGQIRDMCCFDYLQETTQDKISCYSQTKNNICPLYNKIKSQNFPSHTP